jgi:hypothetical protein
MGPSKTSFQIPKRYYLNKHQTNDASFNAFAKYNIIYQQIDYHKYYQALLFGSDSNVAADTTIQRPTITFNDTRLA